MWPSYSPACIRAVKGLLQAGGSLSAYRANPQVGVEPRKDSWAWRLEREIEKRFKVKHAVAVNSGTAALHAALYGLPMSSKRGRVSDMGDVVTSPYTFSATVSAIVHAGYTPVFADVDPYTFCITKETVKRVLTKKTRAILPVHLFGGMADIGSLSSLGLPVVEDACQAVGAHKGGAYSGTLGVAGAYSFNGAKNVPAGEAGALATNSDKVAHHARLLMNHAENFGAKWVGYNYRPTEVTACIAWHGLQDLEERNQRRIDLAYELAKSLHNKLPKGLLYNVQPFRGEHVYYVVPWLLDDEVDRARFIKRMAKRGIPVGAGYITPPLHKYPAFRKYQRTPLPVVEELSSKTLCILSTLTPDRPLSYAEEVAKAMRESLK